MPTSRFSERKDIPALTKGWKCLSNNHILFSFYTHLLHSRLTFLLPLLPSVLQCALTTFLQYGWWGRGYNLMQVSCLLPQEEKAVYGSPSGDCKCHHVKIHQSPSFPHVMAKCQLNSSSALLGSEPIGRGCILKLRNAVLLCLCHFNFYVCFIHMSNNYIYIYTHI